MPVVSHKGNNPIINNIEIKYAKGLNYVLNQSINVTKLERFTAFAISIVDNLCLLLQYK